MPVHHVIDSDDQIRTCPYCGSDIAQSESCENKHWESTLYKEITCGKCKTKRLIRMEFLGDGHDSWFDEAKDNIDKRIEQAHMKDAKRS